MKKAVYFFVSASVGAAVAVLLTLGWGDEPDQPAVSTTPEVTPTASVRPDDRQQLVIDAGLHTVAVQTFQGSKLVRQGSGIVLSSDGLIATTYDVAPPSQPASPSFAPYVYQILTEEKILRASVVSRDYSKNLALLKADTGDLSVGELAEDTSYQSGKDFVLVGKIVNFSKPVIFSQRASLLYTAGKTILVDTVSNTFLSGAGAVDGEGQYLGLVYVRSGKIFLTDAGTVGEFLDSYLRSVKK
jgi:S1-C subfamily serine protease